MSLRLYKVEWTPLHYPNPLEDKELDFLEYFQSDDGTYYIEEEMLDETIEAYNEQGKEVPKELVSFLREQLEREDEPLSIAVM